MDRDEAWQFLVKICLKITCAKRVSWGGRSGGSSPGPWERARWPVPGRDHHNPTAESMYQTVKILNRR